MGVIDTDATVSENGERCMIESEVTGNVIRGSISFERYEPSSPGCGTEMTGGTLLAMSCYGNFRMK